MPPQRRRRAPGPVLSPGGLLDWSSARHWAWQARPCRYCGNPTFLRDSQGRPAEKVCAEAALAEVSRIVDVYSGQESL